MSPTAVALLGYAAWTLALVFSLGVFRTSVALSKGKKANTFSPSGEDLGGFGLRLTRAHANCYENLPIAGAVTLYAIATGQTAITDPLAYALLGARVAQSLVHLVSTAPAMVMVRLVFFLAQVAILASWLLAFFSVI